MLVFRAKVSDDKIGERTMVCVTEHNDADELDRTVMCIRAFQPIAEAIMQAHSDGSDRFIYKGIKYRLLEYQDLLNGEIDFTKFVRPPKIYLYKNTFPYGGKCSCGSGYDNYSALVKTYSKNKTTGIVSIEIQRCKKCKNFFIEELSLCSYQRMHGVLVLDIIGEESKNSFRDPSSYEPNTILSRHGYSAGDYAPPQEIRECIIAMLIDSELCSKDDIMSILTRFIRERGDRCPYALPRWESDLDFTKEYKKYRNYSVAPS